MYHLVLNPGEYELEFKINNQVVKKVKQLVGADLTQVNVKLNSEDL